LLLCSGRKGFDINFVILTTSKLEVTMENRRDSPSFDFAKDGEPVEPCSCPKKENEDRIE
jgi:hypothetical protein